jgi:hypothetical protein
LHCWGHKIMRVSISVVIHMRRHSKHRPYVSLRIKELASSAVKSWSPKGRWRLATRCQCLSSYRYKACLESRTCRA